MNCKLLALLKRKCVIRKIRVVSVFMIGVVPLLHGSLAQTEWPTFRTQGPASAAVTGTGDFYVASNGDDSWPGSISQPFRTLDRARLAVQGLKTQVSGRTITVLIRNGTYFLPSTW